MLTQTSFQIRILSLPQSHELLDSLHFASGDGACQDNNDGMVRTRMITHQIAKTVAEETAKTVAEENARKTAHQIDQAVAEDTAQTVARVRATKTAHKIAKSVAEQTAKQIAHQSAEEVAEEAVKLLGESQRLLLVMSGGRVRKPVGGTIAVKPRVLSANTNSETGTGEPFLKCPSWEERGNVICFLLLTVPTMRHTSSLAMQQHLRLHLHC
jgi:hypothetical protein